MRRRVVIRLGDRADHQRLAVNDCVELLVGRAVFDRARWATFAVGSSCPRSSRSLRWRSWHGCCSHTRDFACTTRRESSGCCWRSTGRGVGPISRSRASRQRSRRRWSREIAESLSADFAIFRRPSSELSATGIFRSRRKAANHCIQCGQKQPWGCTVGLSKKMPSWAGVQLLLDHEPLVGSPIGVVHAGGLVRAPYHDGRGRPFRSC